ncbi:calponin homology (CH) domain-containing protein [Ditylenchus destructor]|nr:calponin homology (CH) domain-containing protein [Ditylenchus destructor]
MSRVVNVYTTSASTENELIEWVNERLKSEYVKIEQLRDGAGYCRFTEALFPGSIQPERVKWDSRQKRDWRSNWKLVQTAWKQIGVDRIVPVKNLVKGKFDDNFEFLKWFKSFYDTNSRRHICSETEPLARMDAHRCKTKDKTSLAPIYIGTQPSISSRFNANDLAKYGQWFKTNTKSTIFVNPGAIELKDEMEILSLFSVIESIVAKFFHRNLVYRWFMRYFLDVCRVDPRAEPYKIPQPERYTDLTDEPYAVILSKRLAIEIPLDAKFYDSFCNENYKGKSGDEKFGPVKFQTDSGESKTLELSDRDNAKTLMSRLLIDFSTNCYWFCKKGTPNRIAVPLFVPARVHKSGQAPVKFEFNKYSLLYLLKTGQIKHSSSSCRLCGSIQQESRDGICSRHSK